MNEPTITIPVKLLEELIEVCNWYKSGNNLSRKGETYHTCPDQDAFDFLDNEAKSIKSMAQQFLDKHNQEIEALDGLKAFVKRIGSKR